MVYQRYIVKGGKRIGPYFYDSVKGEGGKIKTVYLGKTLPKGFSEKPVEEKPRSPSPLYNEKIGKLKENIAVCESRKEKLKSRIVKIQERYKKGEINYSRYELLLNHYLQGKSLQHWLDYYDSYKVRVNEQIKKYESDPVTEKLAEPKKEDRIEEIVTRISTDISKKVLDDYVKEKRLDQKKSLTDIVTLEAPASKVIIIILLALILIPAFSFFKTTLMDESLQNQFMESGTEAEKELIEEMPLSEKKVSVSERIFSQAKKVPSTVTKTVASPFKHALKYISESKLSITGMITPSPTGFTIAEEENITLPDENITIPEENIAPEENVTLPEENITTPEENITLPEENITLPERNITLPEENITLPEENVTIPEEPLLENLTETLTGFEDKLKAKPYKPKVRLKNLLKEENKFVLEAESEDKKGKIVIRGLYNVSDIEDLQVTTLSSKKVSKGLITTPVVLANISALENATITLQKEGNVNAIVKCETWDFVKQRCESWTETSIPFVDDGESITFTVTEFSGYAGAELTIINVQSYPTVGGNWTVEFITNGTANLIIKAVNGTTWSNTDEGGNDLRFLEIRCGDQVLNYEWVDNSVLIQDYTCDESGYETSKVLTAGKHILEFKFGDDVEYAYNQAFEMIDSDGGILVYSNASTFANVPGVFLYNRTEHNFSGVFNGGMAANVTTLPAVIEHTWLKCAPTRDECALLTADSNDDLNIQFYSWVDIDGAGAGGYTKCWNNGTDCGNVTFLEQTLYTGDSDKAAMMYENKTASLLIVWGRNANSSIGYSVWNGAGFTSQNGSMIDTLGTNLYTRGTPDWFMLAQETNETGNISMIYSTTDGEASILRWSPERMEWACNMTIAVNTSTSVAATNLPKVAITYEQMSGDLLAIEANYLGTTATPVGFNYTIRPAGTCSYTTTRFATTQATDMVDLAPILGSDVILAAIRENSGDDAEWLLWNGNAWSSNSPTDATTAAEAGGNKLIEPACVPVNYTGGNDTCIVVYADVSSRALDWQWLDPTKQTYIPAEVSTNINQRADYVNNFTDTLEYVDCYPYPPGPFWNESILCIFEDDSDDIWAKVFNNNTNWSNAEPLNGTAIVNTTTLSEFRSFDFDFIKKENVTVTEAPANTIPNDPTLILNFTYDNTNYTNESMWCQVYVDDPDSEADMSVDIIIMNSTSSDIDNAVQQYSVTGAFTGLTEPTYVQWQLDQYNFTKDDYVWCQARVNDQVLTSNWVNSSSLLVQNYPIKISDPLGNWSVNEDFTQFTLDWTTNYTDPDDVEGKEAYTNWTYEMNDTTILTVSIDNDTDIVTIAPISDAFGSVEINWTVLDDDNAQYNETVVWTVNSVNDAPVVENITFVGSPSVTLSEAVPTNVEISFLAMDLDGNDDIDNSSAYLNITLDGADMRENNTIGIDPSCTAEAFNQGGSLNTTALWYNCTIKMQHWDLGGSWKCTAHVGDGTVNSTYKEVGNCFTVADTLALNMTSANITWAQLLVGDVNKLMQENELNITNVGNQNISNLTLRAMDLIGEGATPTDIIGAENFTATWGERQCDYGQYLVNATHLQILDNGTGGSLNFGPPTTYWTNNATHVCLESFSDIIAQQAYSTIGHELAANKYWLITGGTGAIN